MQTQVDTGRIGAWIAGIEERFVEHPMVGVASLLFAIALTVYMVVKAARIGRSPLRFLKVQKDDLIRFLHELRGFLQDPISPQGLDVLLVAAFALPFLLLVLNWVSGGLLDRLLNMALGERDPWLDVILVLGCGVLALIAMKLSLNFLKWWVSSRGRLPEGRSPGL